MQSLMDKIPQVCNPPHLCSGKNPSAILWSEGETLGVNMEHIHLNNCTQSYNYVILKDTSLLNKCTPSRKPKNIYSLSLCKCSITALCTLLVPSKCPECINQWYISCLKKHDIQVQEYTLFTKWWAYLSTKIIWPIDIHAFYIQWMKLVCVVLWH